jgi:hypothetical protein
VRRIAIGAAVVGGVAVAARVLAPKLHARMPATCKAMFEHMPEDCRHRPAARGGTEKEAQQVMWFRPGLLGTMARTAGGDPSAGPWAWCAALSAAAGREEAGSEPRVGHSSR